MVAGSSAHACSQQEPGTKRSGIYPRLRGPQGSAQPATCWRWPREGSETESVNDRERDWITPLKYYKIKITFSESERI